MIQKMYVLVLFLLVSLCTQAQDYYWYQSQKLEFKQDTAQLELEVRDLLDKDYSTLGIVEAANYLEQGYDKLLNKYYKKLMEVLDEDNKKLLRDSQRKWIVLRDSDKELVRGIVNQARTEAGGGTIWGVVGADARADITRRRVIELYNYMMIPNLN